MGGLFLLETTMAPSQHCVLVLPVLLVSGLGGVVVFFYLVAHARVQFSRVITP